MRCLLRVHFVFIFLACTFFPFLAPFFRGWRGRSLFVCLSVSHFPATQYSVWHIFHNAKCFDTFHFWIIKSSSSFFLFSPLPQYHHYVAEKVGNPVWVQVSGGLTINHLFPLQINDMQIITYNLSSAFVIILSNLASHPPTQYNAG